MNSNTQPAFFTDADNTLWDTNAVYADAQLSLLKEIEASIGNRITEKDRLAFVRKLDQEIARTHPAGLRYPQQLLVRALLGPKAIPEATFAGLVNRFLERIKTTVPALRRGVKEGLNELAEAGIRITIVTESSEASTIDRLAAHGLMHLIERIHSVAKSSTIYSDLGRGSANRYFVGDQLDVDILLASAAGFTTIHFPSEFIPSWAVGQTDLSDFRVDSYLEVPRIVLLAHRK